MQACVISSPGRLIADFVEFQVEVGNENLLTDGQTVLVVITKKLVNLVNIQLFFSVQQLTAADKVGGGFRALIRQLY